MIDDLSSRPTLDQLRRKVRDDLTVILSEAERSGTLDRLKDVGIHFAELELRMLLKQLGP